MATRIHPSRSFVEFSRAEVEGSIPRRFERQVERYPHRLAIKTARSEITYSDLNESGNSVARSLLSQRGPGPEQIALLFDRDAMMVGAAFGVLKAGKVWVPLDASYPGARNRHILEHSQAELVLTDEQHADLGRELARGVCPTLDVEALGHRGPRDNVAVNVSPDALACILYTSGSTGVPKGVIHNHRTLLHFIMRYTNAFGIGPEDRVSQLSSLSHIAGVSDLLRGLLNGAAVLPLDPRKLDPAGLAAWLSAEEITICHMIPTLFLHLTGALTGKEEFRKLRLIHLGGESVSKEAVELYQQRFPPSCLLLNNLGCTEVSSFRQYLMDHSTVVSTDVVPVGYPVQDTVVSLVDEAGMEIPPGQVGEIAVKSRYLSLGYWREPVLSSAAFTPVPGDPGERIYRTGDLGRLLPDGCLVHLGRRDSQVQIRGYRVETTEIENVLLESGQIEACAVVAIEDPQGDRQLVAYVVPGQQQAATPAELRRLLQERLPAYMIPAAFVRLGTLPLLPNGKLDRRALPAPDWAKPLGDRPVVAPQSEAEHTLAAIFAEILQVEEVSLSDSFLELGGNSLKAMQVMARVRAAFGVALPPRELFEAPTLAALAARLAADDGFRHSVPLPRIVPVARDILAPLSYAQQRMWFFNQLEPDSPLYNIPVGPLGKSSRPCGSRWIGALDIGALDRSLGEIVRRHQVLRARFPLTGTGPVQQTVPAGSFQLSVEDLSDLPADEREDEARRRVLAEIRHPFDLARDLPIRATLLRLAADEHVLALVIHQIAYDRWSRGVLLRELALLYSALAAGRPSPLPELTLQYQDYASWQRDYVETEAVKREISYWRERLSGASPLLELPLDRTRPARQTYRGSCVSVSLSGPLITALEALARSQGASLSMALVTGLLAVLSRCTGQTDLLVGMVVAGRNRVELEDLIGCFTNTLVLRSNLSGDPTFRELLSQVRGVMLGAYAHQELPFEKLVEELRPERSPRYHPVFQVLFNYLDVPRQTKEIPGLRIEDFEVGAETALTDLSVDIERNGEGLACYFTYNSDLFEPTTISHLAGHYRTLLETAGDDPEQRLSVLSPASTEAVSETERLLWQLERISEAEAERALAAGRPQGIGGASPGERKE